jgi:hypothetical protein
MHEQVVVGISGSKIGLAVLEMLQAKSEGMILLGAVHDFQRV